MTLDRLHKILGSPTDLDTWLNQLTTKQTDVSQNLTQTLGTLEDPILEQVKALSLSQLALLAKNYKDFTSVNDLTNWLQAQADTSLPSSP